MDGYGRYDTCIARKDTKMVAVIPSIVAWDDMAQEPYIRCMQTEVEAILVEGEDDAVSSVRRALLLWSAGLAVIVGNLILNPLWVGPWYTKLWLPAVYVGALVVLLVSKFNRRTEHGTIVFEPGWIRVVHKSGDRAAFRIAELEAWTITSGKPGFFRNPLVTHSLGYTAFRHGDEAYSFKFRLLRHDDSDVLHDMYPIAGHASTLTEMS